MTDGEVIGAIVVVGGIGAAAWWWSRRSAAAAAAAAGGLASTNLVAGSSAGTGSSSSADLTGINGPDGMPLTQTDAAGINAAAVAAGYPPPSGTQTYTIDPSTGQPRLLNVAQITNPAIHAGALAALTTMTRDPAYPRNFGPGGHMTPAQVSTLAAARANGDILGADGFFYLPAAAPPPPPLPKLASATIAATGGLLTTNALSLLKPTAPSVNAAAARFL